MEDYAVSKYYIKSIDPIMRISKDMEQLIDPKILISFMLLLLNLKIWKPFRTFRQHTPSNIFHCGLVGSNPGTGRYIVAQLTS